LGECHANGKRYKRETNTMPQWAGSCWYYLRYIDAKNDKAFCDPKKEKYWSPVDLYVGGAEHAVLHLLYSRFWHKVLFRPRPRPHAGTVHEAGQPGHDLGDGVLRSQRCKKRGDHFLRECERRRRSCIGAYPERPSRRPRWQLLLEDTDVQLLAVAEKMSKARKNVVNPDEVVSKYGADSMRLYEMFMGPLEATKPWSMRGVEGVYRF